MLTDKNGKTFEVNQVVEISNAWGTTDNGLWVIESCSDTGLWLHKLNKDMRKSTNKMASTGWPLHCYHNDSFKRCQINKYNQDNAQIEILCPYVEPAQKPVNNEIKIQKKGIRKGTTFCSCFYYKTSDGNIVIHARHYDQHIPRELGTVRNDSDSMTDYFETDSCVLTPDSPFYKQAERCCS